MTLLTQLGLLRFSGKDVRDYLQGQLSNDLQLLTPEQSLLASCNSAQGRVQVILTLIERADGIVAVLPAAMIEPALARLRKYVLRSKVAIDDASDQLKLFAASRDELHAQQYPIPQHLGMHEEQQGTSVIRWRDHQERFLVMRPSTANDHAESTHGDLAWLLADIRAGLPQVLPETHESFVAQMLNLDVLGGISFNKGCYTGQEIIARAHFRGTVKRRMFRFIANCPAPKPGARLTTEGTHAGDVVMSATTESGCELLATIHLSHREHKLKLEDQTDAVVSLSTLPYEVPSAE